MSGIALAFALSAAILHATWNTFLARARDPQAAAAVALLVGEIAFAPVVAVVWRVHPSASPFIVASGALELLYFALLAAAYRRVAMSVVYPVARGGAPVVVLVIGVVALGSAASTGSVLGVLCVAAGVLFVRGIRNADPNGLAFGFAIAFCIAGYTLVDKHGVRHAGPLPYLELTLLVPALVFASAMGKERLRSELRVSTVAAGIAAFGAYSLVLAALQRAPAASVAAVRETSVVIAAVLARALLKERVGLGRFAGAVLVAGGVALISLS